MTTEQHDTKSGNYRPAYLTHMSMEQSESHTLRSHHHAQTYYNSMEDSADQHNHHHQSNHSKRQQYEDQSKIPSAESMHDRMQRELNQGGRGNHSHLPNSNYCGTMDCHNEMSGNWLASLIPKKRKKRRHANRNYDGYSDVRLIEEMIKSSTAAAKNKSNIVGCLWGFFLLITLGWVVIFTLSEGHIDWAEIMNYEPQHQTPALQQKTGLRLFSFFGIGYLLPGVVSLLSLFVGLKLPFVHNTVMSKLVQLPAMELPIGP